MTPLKKLPSDQDKSVSDQFDAILAEIDRIPKNANPSDPLEWDEYGLPK